MIEFEFNLNEVQRSLHNVMMKIENGYKEVSPEITELMIDNVRSHFEDSRGPNEEWPRLKNGKQSHLNKSGDLFNTLKEESLIDRSRLTSEQPYAAIQNFGGFAGRNRASYIPARPYMWLDQRTVEKIRQKYIQFLMKYWGN